METSKAGSLPAKGFRTWFLKIPQSEKNANPNYKDVQANDKPSDPELVKWILNKKYGGMLD